MAAEERAGDIALEAAVNLSIDLPRRAGRLPLVSGWFEIWMREMASSALSNWRSPPQFSHDGPRSRLTPAGAQQPQEPRTRHRILPLRE